MDQMRTINKNSYLDFNNGNTYKKCKRLSAVFVMVCIYIFIFIERPWESIRYLQGIPIERTFAIAMILAAFFAGKLRIVSSPINKWVYSLLALHFILSPFAFRVEYAVDQGLEYAKMVVLYLLMLSVVDDEYSLKTLINVYVFSMMFYMIHSLFEYHNGRHGYAMGITRMLGVDSTFNDPNAFGASVVLSLPFVYSVLRSEAKTIIRNVYYIYFVLAVLCIVLTGSRTSAIALVILLLLWSLMQRGSLRIIMPAICIVSIFVVWLNMPEQKRDRIRTLWDDNAGTVGAHMSAEGRLIGWEVSWKMFKREPFTGVGAGGKNYIGYRIANNIDEEGQESPTESHVLYGQILAEFGVAGAILFAGLIYAILRCCLLTQNQLLAIGLDKSFSYMLCGAIIASLLLLLLFGFGGHNFYRPLWLWLAAWSGCLLRLSTNEPCESFGKKVV